MSENTNFPYTNIIPMHKADHFGVYLGKVTSSGEIIEGESVGVAFLKNGSKNFRLKLFLLPQTQYFIAPDKKDDTKYVVLSLDEYVLPNGETRTNWNRVGNGHLVGAFIALKIHLLAEDVFLCLFPDKLESIEEVLAC